MSRGLIVVMATITHLSLVVLTTGIVVFVTHGDVIVERDAGTLLGPAMVLGSMACVFFPLARRFGVEGRDARESGDEAPRGRRILPLALTAALSSYVVMLLIGATVYASERGQAAWLVLFAGRYAASLFVTVTSLEAGVVVAGFALAAKADAARARSFD
ncbi:DUF6121 family protein [Frondihabitans australicus]|uniref:Uncharacterized protein n=1 Tax=Frondihabitans australicus TaxID=386892 RepID=A0A495IIJ6_9MICO|nr:DUF6121 family protein [Frondihabitans australicus]RKR75520.1 hypothetical protein C8E83_2668 [Frondihabitans australicus]